MEQVQQILPLLQSKNDTDRFVGLALLKAILDSTPEIRDDGTAVTNLWQSISPKFIDRLLQSTSPGNKSGSKPKKDAARMVDLAVSVLHAFTVLLPEEALKDQRMVGRIPRLVLSLLNSSKETVKLTLEILTSLVSQPECAQVLDSIQDLTPLTEIAPSHPLVLDILKSVWLNAAATAPDKLLLRARIHETIGQLVVSFKNTDAVTLLAFLGDLFPQLPADVLPESPQWLPSLIVFARRLVTSRPAPAGRAAYTNLAAALLEAYPEPTRQLLLSDSDSHKAADKPISYLFVNLLLSDLRSTFPSLLEKLNSPEYFATSRRLASAFDTLSHFIGWLMNSMDDNHEGEPDRPPLLSHPDLLLRLRTAISETMSVTIEYLRDRWDASFAGAQGLHPDVRASADISTGSSASGRLPLAWDSKVSGAEVGEDPLILSALRALAIWLREDDNEALRKEATGLIDMLVELYERSYTASTSTRTEKDTRQDLRRPILAALEGITGEETGAHALLEQDGYRILALDLLSALERQDQFLRASSPGDAEAEAARAVDIVRVLLPVVEAEQPGPREAWLDLVTKLAASSWDAEGGDERSAGTDRTAPQSLGRAAMVKARIATDEARAATLQLATALLAGVPPAVRRRYAHSIHAVVGLAATLRDGVRRKAETSLAESVDEVLSALEKLVVAPR